MSHSEALTAAGTNRGAARLTGGRSDPGGAWAYGRLEVFDGDFFSGLSDSAFDQELGRRGGEVACRSLGFATGAQLLAGSSSALPGADGTVDTVGRILCAGEFLMDRPTNVVTVYYRRVNGQTSQCNRSQLALNTDNTHKSVYQMPRAVPDMCDVADSWDLVASGATASRVVVVKRT